MEVGLDKRCYWNANNVDVWFLVDWRQTEKEEEVSGEREENLEEEKARIEDEKEKKK